MKLNSFLLNPKKAKEHETKPNHVKESLEDKETSPEGFEKDLKDFQMTKKTKEETKRNKETKTKARGRGATVFYRRTAAKSKHSVFFNREVCFFLVQGQWNRQGPPKTMILVSGATSICGLLLSLDLGN